MGISLCILIDQIVNLSIFSCDKARLDTVLAVMHVNTWVQLSLM